MAVLLSTVFHYLLVFLTRFLSAFPFFLSQESNCLNISGGRSAVTNRRNITAPSALWSFHCGWSLRSAWLSAVMYELLVVVWVVVVNIPVSMGRRPGRSIHHEPNPLITRDSVLFWGLMVTHLTSGQKVHIDFVKDEGFISFYLIFFI